MKHSVYICIYILYIYIYICISATGLAPVVAFVVFSCFLFIKNYALEAFQHLSKLSNLNSFKGRRGVCPGHSSFVLVRPCWPLFSLKIKLSKNTKKIAPGDPGWTSKISKKYKNTVSGRIFHI